MSGSADLTISDVAAEFRIRREHVIALLRSGELAGYDVTPPGAKRKSYRIPRQALDDFKALRSAKQTPEPKRRHRHAARGPVAEYF